jgi:dihydroxyacetone kinase DhaKLM complex PTS-EIIA-like component DhaM
LVGTIPAGVCAHAVCIGITLTTAADWDWDYISTTTITGTGANVLGTSPTITTPTIDTITSAAATALTLQSAGTTALTLSTAQNATFAGTVADSTAILRPLVSGTAVATTSGTSVDFTGIPSWVKRITFVYSGVSSNGVSSFLIQIGPSSAVETSGYLSTGNTTGSGGTVVVTSTAGFIIYEDNPVYTVQGIATIVNVSSNNWVFAQTGRLTAGNATYGGGDKTLASTLARLRFTTVNGTDAFDAGSINILYE